MPFSAYRHRILGVDPGTLFLGYAIIEPGHKYQNLMCVILMHLKNAGDHQDKLKDLLQLQELIETYRPGQMAIESPFWKNVQSMLKVGACSRCIHCGGYHDGTGNL